MARSVIDQLTVLDDAPAAGPSASVTLHLQRAWPRPAGPHLLLEYASADGATVAGQWMRDHDRMVAICQQTPAGVGSADPMVVDAAGGGLMLQPGGADRVLLGLPRLLGRSDARLVSHRPELRAVVRLEGQPRVFYAKAIRPKRLRRLLMTTWHLEDLAPRAFRVPDAIKVDLKRAVLTFAEMPGAVLHEQLDDVRTSSLLHRTGVALRTLHESPPPSHASVHDARAEARVLHAWTDGLRGLVDLDTDALAMMLKRVEARLLDREGTVRATVHRDFHDKQILFGPTGAIGLLDFDELAVGEPELDVANMLAHLELRQLQERCPPSTAAESAAAFVEGYGEGGLDPHRLQVYLESTRLRLACVYACRPRWLAVAHRMLDGVGSAATALEWIIKRKTARNQP